MQYFCVPELRIKNKYLKLPSEFFPQKKQFSGPNLNWVICDFKVCLFNEQFFFFGRWSCIRKTELVCYIPFVLKQYKHTPPWFYKNIKTMAYTNNMCKLKYTEKYLKKCHLLRTLSGSVYMNGLYSDCKNIHIFCSNLGFVYLC